MKTAVRQNHAHCAARSVRSQHPCTHLRVGASHGLADSGADYLRYLARPHTLGAVPAGGVRNLVPDHCGQAGFVLTHRQDSGVHGYFAAGQAEGVDLFGFDQLEFPCEARLVRLGRNPPAYALKDCNRGGIIAELGLAQ